MKKSITIEYETGQGEAKSEAVEKIVEAAAELIRGAHRCDFVTIQGCALDRTEDDTGPGDMYDPIAFTSTVVQDDQVAQLAATTSAMRSTMHDIFDRVFVSLLSRMRTMPEDKFTNQFDALQIVTSADPAKEVVDRVFDSGDDKKDDDTVRSSMLG